MSDRVKILWADDEIDLLKPHLKFLDAKGYDVVGVTNGHDAIDLFEKDRDIEVVFLDESMPGMTGLETLAKIKSIRDRVPVVMITKNEAETVMEEAIGGHISDYLIKPVNPNQILLSLKKLLDNKRLVSETTAMRYQQNFRELFMQINSNPSLTEWVDIYRKVINWELKIDADQVEGMSDILATQKNEANSEFSKFVDREYLNWLDVDKAPVMSHDLLRKKVFPQVSNGDLPTVFLLMDNLRYDQWKVIEPIISELYQVQDEDYFVSILPTTTQYSRNSIFAGMLPADIKKHFPQWWKGDIDEGGKNLYEEDLLRKQVGRVIKKDIKLDYIKITSTQKAKQLLDNPLNYLNNDLTVIVYNFIDMLSHARTEMEVLKELASDERAYRSLTRSWFLHSPVWVLLQKLSERPYHLVIGTDHGTIRVKTPSRIVGDRDTTTNLRYKAGRNLDYKKGDVLEMRDPSKGGLPRPNISTSYVFAKSDHFFLYPNNYNYYNRYFMDTFQHGGISMEEMICPIIKLSPK